MVLVEPFVHPHAVENLLREVIKHGDLQWMEEVGGREVTHNTGTMSKLVESAVNMARLEFGISCVGIGIAERSI